MTLWVMYMEQRECPLLVDASVKQDGVYAAFQCSSLAAEEWHLVSN